MGEGDVLICATCGKPSDVVFFEPVVEGASIAPGTGRCAHHPGKDAVAGCSRCGSFVCEVCVTRTGEETLCPGCFDTLHGRGDLDTTRTSRVRWDYMALSVGVLSVVCSMPFGVVGAPLGLAFGILALVRRRNAPWLRIGFIVAGLALSVVSAGLCLLYFVAMRRK